MMNMIADYLDKLQAVQAHPDPRGLLQVTDVRGALLLEALYVPQTFALEDTRRVPLRTEGESLETIADSSIEKTPQESILAATESGMSMEHLWERADTWLIQGGAGSGKTTLVKYLALTEAQRFQAGNGYFPVLIDAAEFISTWQNAPSWIPGQAILDYLHGVYAQKNNLSTSATEAFSAHLEAALRSHQALLFIDGLDQIYDRLWQQYCVQALEYLFNHYPGNRCVVTSRPLHDVRGMLRQGFRHAVLEPFNAAQIRQFFQRWTYALEKNTANTVLQTEAMIRDRALRKAEEIDARIHAKPELYTRLNTPFMCTLIGIIYRNLGTLPAQPVMLYQLCVETLITQSEEQYRTSHPEAIFPNRTKIREMLQDIAYYLQEQQRNTLSQAELENILANTEDKPHLTSEHQAFIAALREQNGILQVIDQNQYGFLHTLFQEYLASGALLRHPAHLPDHLQNYLFNPNWRGVLRLAAAQQGMHSESLGTAFIKMLCEHPHPREAALHYSFRIAFLCMLETQVSHQYATHLLETWLELYHRHIGLQAALNRLLREVSSQPFQAHDLTVLREMLRNPEVSVRSLAVEAIGHLRTPDSQPLLMDLLATDTAPAVRAKSIEMLGESGDPAMIPALMGTLRSDSALAVRRCAAQALGRMEHPAIASALHSNLADADPTIRCRSVEALGSMRASDSVPILLELLRHDPLPGIRWRAAEALGKLRDTAAVPILLEALRDDVDNAVRWSAAEALGDLQDRRALPVLLKTLREDFDPSVRWSAAEALGRLRDPAALHVLLNTANYDKSAPVRSKACQSLGYLRDTDAMPTLLKALEEDTSPTVRRYAAEALGDIGDDMAVTVLLHALHQDEDAGVRWSITDAFAVLKDPSAIPALLEAFHYDPDLNVRWHAARTLEILDLGEVL